MSNPRLARILVYPVKSLDPVRPGAWDVLPSGALADDRRFALFDEAGKYVNGKKHSRVHLLRSVYDPAELRLRLSVGADGPFVDFGIREDRGALEHWLGEFFGFPVTFRENAGAGFPDDTESPGPTVISTATLGEVGSWFGLDVEQARARFRANLEIDGVPAFWEDRLYGPAGTAVRFRVGGVLFDGINPCQRCVVPTRDQRTGEVTPEFTKRFSELRKEKLPGWAETSRFNHYYRLAINTKLADPGAGRVAVNDGIEVIGPVGPVV